MSTQEVFVQQFERLFDHYQQALTRDTVAPRGALPVEWNSVPVDERDRMVAAARLAIMEMEMEANAQHDDTHRKYYAKPGDAEWGC
jgi:hypothetical protein